MKGQNECFPFSAGWAIFGTWSEFYRIIERSSAWKEDRRALIKFLLSLRRLNIISFLAQKNQFTKRESTVINCRLRKARALDLMRGVGALWVRAVIWSTRTFSSSFLFSGKKSLVERARKHTQCARWLHPCTKWVARGRKHFILSLSFFQHLLVSQAKEPFMAKHMRTFSAPRTHFSECGLLMAPVFFYFACYHHHFPPSHSLRERAVCVT